VSLNYVTLILDEHDGAGNQIVRGAAALVPSTPLVAPADHMDISLAPVPAVFGSYGPPQVRLIATDSTDVSPAGWQWTLAFSNTPGSPAARSFYLLYANGATQYLSALTTVPGSLPITITNLDGGSAVTGGFPVGAVDGGNA
jgi:hypothetical protein